MLVLVIGIGMDSAMPLAMTTMPQKGVLAHPETALTFRGEFVAQASLPAFSSFQDEVDGLMKDYYFGQSSWKD